MRPEIGSIAPDFAVADQDGNTVKLSSLRGKKVILYFYPKDMTPGCTAEACNLRDNYSLMKKMGYEVLGVSTDGPKMHKKFVEKEKLPFRLLADEDKSLHEAYGTWVEKSMYGRKYMGTARVTFVINETGRIEDVIEKVDTKNHAAQIIKMGLSTAPANVSKSAASAKKPSKANATKSSSGKTAKKKVVKKTAKSIAKRTAKKK